jgi:hypothetical protein
MQCPQRNGEVDTKLESDLDTSEMENTATPPPQGRENRQELFILIHVLCSDPKTQGETQEFFNDLAEKDLGNLAPEGHIIIRRIINHPNDQDTRDLHEWVQRLLEETWDRTSRKKATVSTHNLGPVDITLSMDVIEDTPALVPYVSYLQDILLHGQDIHRIKRAIGEFNSDYHIFSDIGTHTNDDIRRTNYTCWRRSAMVNLTMLHKDIFNTQKYTKYE